ncbi:MAG TPA: hypothetical protein VGD08_00860 [Stellaceae bacterium]
MAFDLPVPNLFLASLPQEEFGRLRPHLELVTFAAEGISSTNWGSPSSIGGMTFLREAACTTA